MRINFQYLVIIKLLLTQFICGDFFSRAGAGFSAFGDFASSFYCTFNECCRSPWLAHNFTNLTLTFNQNLFGQHLVEESVIKLLQGHIQNNAPQKPLVLSFHGWTGTGKTYVSRLIAENLYKRGIHSHYVQFIPVVRWFREGTNTNEQLNLLHETITSTLAICSQSLFIFDEVNYLNPKIMNSIVTYMDYPSLNKGIDFTRAIYILLSNRGAVKINTYTMLQFKSGKNRKEITLQEMHKLINKEVYSEDGAYKKSELIIQQVVDYFIPFLPLEKQHVRMCIKQELKRMNISESRTLIDGILGEMDFSEDSNYRFSISGCKRIGAIINSRT